MRYHAFRVRFSYFVEVLNLPNISRWMEYFMDRFWATPFHNPDVLGISILSIARRFPQETRITDTQTNERFHGHEPFMSTSLPTVKLLFHSVYVNPGWVYIKFYGIRTR